MVSTKRRKVYKEERLYICTMVETKQQLIEKIKAEVVKYAQPRQINLRSKAELTIFYNKASSLGLTSCQV